MDDKNFQTEGMNWFVQEELFPMGSRKKLILKFKEKNKGHYLNDIKGCEQTRELLFDIVMHYMVQADLRQGLSKQEYELRFFLKDMLNGVCGAQASHAIKKFPAEKLRILLQMIMKLYKCGSSIYLFREVMRHIYPDSLIYASNETDRQMLVYVGAKETDEERERLEFLQDMFLPIDFQVFLFWEHHFGIIDVDETMRLDEVILF